MEERGRGGIRGRLWRLDSWDYERTGVLPVYVCDWRSAFSTPAFAADRNIMEEDRQAMMLQCCDRPSDLLPSTRMSMKIHRQWPAALVLLTVASVALSAQESTGGKQTLQLRVAELKQSMTENRAKLQKYQWIETTLVAIKGKNRKIEQSACRYGPDGQVQKAPIGPPQDPQNEHGGLSGRVAQKKKTGEIGDYMDRLKSLISHYASLDSQAMQAAFQSGKANLNLSSAGTALLTFTDYYKPGDQISFTLSAATKKLQSYDVNTYLDDPKKDLVTVTNAFSSLPDGTRYLQQTVLNARSKQIEIRMTNSDYTAAGQ
jgi:hypothetical protein